MPIQIDFLANVRQLLRGTDDAEQAFEDVADSLDDAALDGEQATERLERGFKELSDVTRRETRDMRQSLDRNVTDGVGRGREAIREFRGEAVQNLSEVASSFDGTIDGIADGFQGLAGGASASLLLLGGPAAAAGAALAGVGLVGGAMFSKLSEDSDRARELVSENFRQMAENGVEAWRSVEAEQQRLTDAYDEHETEIKQIADLTGLSFEQVAAAWAGNKAALDIVNGAYAEMKANLRDTPFTSSEAADATIRGWDAVIGKLTTVTDAYDAAAAKADRLALQQSTALREAIRDAGTATREVDALGNELYTLPDETQVLVLADTGQALLDVSAFKGDLDGIPETVTTTAELAMPDVAAYVAEIERQFRGRRVRVGTTLVTPYGQEIR